MKISLIVFGVICIFFGCSSYTTPKSQGKYNLKPTEYSSDESYGFSEANPIKVGGVKNDSGASNEWNYLSNLTNDSGEAPKIKRLGSCCPFKTQNGFMGGGLLDHYQLIFPSSNDTLILYLNMYDYEVPRIPVGLKSKL